MDLEAESIEILREGAIREAKSEKITDSWDNKAKENKGINLRKGRGIIWWEEEIKELRRLR